MPAPSERGVTGPSTESTAPFTIADRAPGCKGVAHAANLSAKRKGHPNLACNRKLVARRAGVHGRGYGQLQPAPALATATMPPTPPMTRQTVGSKGARRCRVGSEATNTCSTSWVRARLGGHLQRRDLTLATLERKGSPQGRVGARNAYLRRAQGPSNRRSAEPRERSNSRCANIDRRMRPHRAALAYCARTASNGSAKTCMTVRLVSAVAREAFHLGRDPWTPVPDVRTG